MNDYNVWRAGDFIIVGTIWFKLHDLVDEVDRRLEAAGSYHRPPFFYTGSPYGEALLALGVQPIKALDKLPPIEFVGGALDRDRSTRPWFGEPQAWPVIFDVVEIAMHNKHLHRGWHSKIV